jgi:hypothetical protein
MKKGIAISCMVALVLPGCATSSKDIAPSYVSPLQYQAFDCEQIAGEMRRIQVRVDQLAGRLDEAATNDKLIVGAGVLLFWPALFFVGGTKQQEAEFARLRGEYESLQQAATVKKCKMAPVETPTPAATPLQPVAAPAQ